MEVAITKKTVKKVQEKSKKLLLPFLMFFAILFGITIVPNFLNNHRQYIFQPMINSHEGININYFPLVNNQEIKNEKIEKNEDEVEVVIEKNKNNENEKLFNDNKKENKNENDKDNDNDLNDNSIIESKNDNVSQNKNNHDQRVNFRTFLFLIFVIMVSLMFILIIEKNNSRSFMRKHGGNDNNNIFNEDGYHNI